ncbi:MAG TPA: N-acetylmuramic acid 6-phosphate etherase [Jatrophihabitans sp.]|nr:N-acetylmuramic acid 6-phosphate etherase [Jatrophihabitans sp.]
MVTGDPSAAGPQLDVLDTDQVVELLLRAEERVVPAVRASARAIAGAAVLLGDRLRAGGRVVLVGAGTSGRLAVSEAAELPGTFGLAPDRCIGILAGGGHSLAGTDRDEDDAAAGAADLAAVRPTAGDVVVAVAASGRTPYTVAAAETARAAGAGVIAVVTAGSSPLAALATVAIEVAPGAEVLRGSTRLSAGTAQKVALNALTTSALARAGRVHGDLMVDVVAANEKLRRRSAAIVAEIAGCDDEAAHRALAACGWQARAAVLQLAAGLAPDAARATAGAHRSLREALGSLGRGDPRC